AAWLHGSAARGLSAGEFAGRPGPASACITFWGESRRAGCGEEGLMGVPGRPGDAVATDIAHPARVYDYWLGGKDNYAADRAAGDQVLAVMPEILDTVRGNRQFLVRAVRFLRDAGIRQFIDIGSGLTSSPNVHEIAQAGGTGARVVYVDNDPVVSVHAEALMARNHTTAVARADLRDVDEVLSRAGELLDLARPAGLLFVGCLHH